MSGGSKVIVFIWKFIEPKSLEILFAFKTSHLPEETTFFFLWYPKSSWVKSWTQFEFVQ